MTDGDRTTENGIPTAEPTAEADGKKQETHAHARTQARETERGGGGAGLKGTGGLE